MGREMLLCSVEMSGKHEKRREHHGHRSWTSFSDSPRKIVQTLHRDTRTLSVTVTAVVIRFLVLWRLHQRGLDAENLSYASKDWETYCSPICIRSFVSPITYILTPLNPHGQVGDVCGYRQISTLLMLLDLPGALRSGGVPCT